MKSDSVDLDENRARNRNRKLLSRELSKDEEEATSALFALIGTRAGEKTTSESRQSPPSGSPPVLKPPRTFSESTADTRTSEVECMDDDDISLPTSEDSKPSDPKTAKRPFFPEVLMTILTDPTHNQVITFLPGGTAFCILQPKIFEANLMPRYFSINTFISFTRKLKRWGFESVQDSKHGKKPTFQHALFRKNDWEDCRKIKCMGKYAKVSTSPVPPDSGTSNGTHLKSEVPSAIDGHCNEEAQEKRSPNAPTTATLAARPVSQDSLTSKPALLVQAAAAVNGTPPATGNLSVRGLLSSQEDNEKRAIIEAAIDTLMRDKDHSLQVLRKHQDRIKNPSIKGVVPLTDQLLTGDGDTITTKEEGETKAEQTFCTSLAKNAIV